MCKIFEAIASAGLGGGVTLLFGVLIMWIAVAHYRQERRAFRLPTTPLGRARAGAIEVAGEVVADGLVRSPASGVEAVWYRIDLEQGVDTTDSDGAASIDWVRVTRIVEGVPFWVDDGTGRARVELAEVDLREGVAEQDAWSGELDTLPERVRELLAKHECTKGKHRVAETRLCAGARIKAAGVASQHDEHDVAAASGYRDAKKRAILTLRGTEAKPLAVGPVDIERRLGRESAVGFVFGLVLVAFAVVLIASALSAC